MKQLLVKALGTVALIAGVVASAPSYAATYLASADFNGAQGGTTGDWFYGVLNGSNFTQLTANGGNSFIGPDQYNTPLIVGEPANIFIHPGQFLEVADVRFVAPSAGTYIATFTGYLSDQSCGSCGGTDGVTLSVGDQREKLTHDSYVPATITTGPVKLGSGQSFDFAVSPNNNFYYDSTQTIISVSAVPEPAVWAMLLLGFGGIGWAMRGNRRTQGALAA